MTKAAVSIGFTSKNENGDREVTFEFSQSLLQRIFNIPEKTKVFVQKAESTTWYEKVTGKKAGTEWDLKCLEVVEGFRQNYMIWDNY